MLPKGWIYVQPVRTAATFRLPINAQLIVCIRDAAADGSTPTTLELVGQKLEINGQAASVLQAIAASQNPS